MLRKISVVLITILFIPCISNAGTTKVIDQDSRFIAYINGIVKDTKTGLEWFVGPDRNTTWDEAKSWTESLSIDGGGWRMPTVKELRTLFKEGSGTLNMTPLLKATGWWIWSVETKDPSSAWLFSFNLGRDYLFQRSSSFNFRAFAVRSRQ
jgi:hypothetical protein